MRIASLSEPQAIRTSGLRQKASLIPLNVEGTLRLIGRIHRVREAIRQIFSHPSAQTLNEVFLKITRGRISIGYRYT